MMIPVTIEGERRLKDGSRTAAISLGKESARAFMDMQDQAEAQNRRIMLTLEPTGADVVGSESVILHNVELRVEELLEAVRSLRTPEPEPEAEREDLCACLWRRADEDTDTWETSCGSAFTGTPKENRMKYCPYCGKELRRF